MTREWSAGDVALVTDSEGQERLAVRGKVAISEPCWWFPDTRTWTKTDAARPLVLIDPEDREQVERLAKAWDDLANGHAELRDEAWTLSGLRLQAALREFAEPPEPKPDEPTGLGAVVEDAEGNTWTRADKGTLPCSPRVLCARAGCTEGRPVSDYLTRPVYDDIAEEARGDWLAERPDPERPDVEELAWIEWDDRRSR